MTTNSDFLRCKEERKNQSFFKVLQTTDTSSENMRAIPYDFVRSFSENELSGKMKIRAKWGSSWEVEISKNSRFYFMEKAGWEKFVRDSFLGDNEFLTFTHKGKMCFTVNIFKQDGKEMLQPGQSLAFLASSSRVKTEQDEEMVSSDLGPKTAEANGGGKDKRNEKKAKESQTSKMTKKAVSVRRDSSRSSSSVAEFTIFIKKSYLIYMVIPVSVAKDHMPEERTRFKIHHPDMNKSWNVVYLTRHGGACFSAGWKRLAKEYPVATGDTCKFTFIKPTELLLDVSKPQDETH